MERFSKILNMFLLTTLFLKRFSKCNSSFQITSYLFLSTLYSTNFLLFFFFFSFLLNSMKPFKSIHDFYILNFNLILPFIFNCTFSLLFHILIFLHLYLFSCTLNSTNFLLFSSSFHFSLTQ